MCLFSCQTRKRAKLNKKSLPGFFQIYLKSIKHITKVACEIANQIHYHDFNYYLQKAKRGIFQFSSIPLQYVHKIEWKFVLPISRESAFILFLTMSNIYGECSWDILPSEYTPRFNAIVTVAAEEIENNFGVRLFEKGLYQLLTTVRTWFRVPTPLDNQQPQSWNVWFVICDPRSSFVVRPIECIRV